MDENELRRRQAALTAITSHPSWPEYQAEQERKIARLQKRALTLALSPEGAHQRELDYIRGWIDALKWGSKMPEVAETRLKKFMESLEREATP